MVLGLNAQLYLYIPTCIYLSVYIYLYIPTCVYIYLTVCVDPVQARRGGEEEAHLPRPRLREDVQENVAAQSSRPAAHRRAALRL